MGGDFFLPRGNNEHPQIKTHINKGIDDKEDESLTRNIDVGAC